MGRLGESEGGVEHMKKDSINLFPTRRSTLLFHMRTNIIERCTNIVSTLLENPQKKSPSTFWVIYGPKVGELGFQLQVDRFARNALKMRHFWRF